MKYSKMFAKTIKGGKKYESTNATLLINAGFVDQVMAGVYTYLPLGLRVLSKIEKIVREEMDKVSQEIFMPAIVPQELWKQTGRLEKVDVLFKASGANDASKLKNDAEYILNPTHEDVVTPLAKQFNLSYKDFPFKVYQIQSKFRNEARAKSGIMRGREFRMKDAYSFHTSVDDLMDHYHNVMKPAYVRVFERLGIGNDTYITLASGGDFTENFSHEFQTRCEAGEDVVFYAKAIETYYNREVAPSKTAKIDSSNIELKEMEEVFGEGVIGVEDLQQHLGVEAHQTIKTLIYETDTNEIIIAAVRGDYDLNEEKLSKAAGCKRLELASEDKVKEITGAEIGYAGIINLPDGIRVFLDEALEQMVNFETGGNKTHYHNVNANWDRDVKKPEKFYDIKIAKEGDLNPETGEVYEVFKAAEVGNIFPLEVKFSNAIDYKFMDQDGKPKPVYMGSYGIGTTRVMGVTVEKNHDDKGIIWPVQIAPYHVHLITLGNDDDSNQQAENIYNLLWAKGTEVLWDDRNEQAGAKFTDADMIGIPLRLVISKRSIENGGAEVKMRKETDSQIIALDKLEEFIREKLQLSNS